MACPFSGAIHVAPEALNEKPLHKTFHTALESDDSTEKVITQHAYGIDTPNFHPEFLKPSFNPEGMQKIVREGIILAGGPAAILLQVARPGVGAGVNQHSNFAYRVEDRLRTTMTFVYAMAFGTPEEKRAIITMVHKAHDPVVGEGYNAHDIDLQMWVAATLYAVGTHLYEEIYGKFDEVTAEQIYDQYAVLACALRVPPDVWPKSRAAFWDYWNKQIDDMTITSDAVSVKNDLLYNKNYPLWIKVHMPLLRLATAEWLPPKMREPFGFKKKSRTRKAGYKVLYAVTKATYPFLPKRIRFFPTNFFLKDMRERLAAGGHIIGRDGEKATL